uniref:PI3K/PI4K catalytic domain-containing protein n=1 Tax=Arcella intermedia TaxID=1963864 RepID=A0A6B2LEF7_9EUKA
MCEIHFSDPGVDSKHFIYKEGDDLSDDMFAQIMFFVFNKIWQNSGMARKPFIHLYRVLPISAKKGFVEFVKSCPIQSYQWVELLKFDEKKKEEFILSAAGAFAGAFILGIRDRHRDNMMISDIGHFFHIDFGYMFNNRTWFDANRFAIPSEIRTLLPHQWEGFLELIGDAYKMLRRNRGLITFLVSKLFSGNKYKEPQIIKCLSGAFYEQMTEKEAVEHIRDLASKGEASPKKAIKDLVHKIESKKKNI